MLTQPVTRSLFGRSPSQKLRKLGLAAAALTLGMGMGTLAYADMCQHPKVQVVNDFSATIKVTKLRYYDFCDRKWREKDVGDTEILAGQSHTYDVNLDGVGNCVISNFRVFYGVRQDVGPPYDQNEFGWSHSVVPVQGGNVPCNTDVKYTIVVRE